MRSFSPGAGRAATRGSSCRPRSARSGGSTSPSPVRGTAAVFGFTLWLVQSGAGRALVAIRENEERARLLGFDTFALKLLAVVLSGTVSAAAGAGYAWLFGYAGASFAAVQYSILPLLWVLLGGAGTVVGPLIGAVLMFYLIDWASGLTPAYMLIAGAALIVITLFAPQGIGGLIRRRIAPWLP